MGIFLSDACLQQKSPLNQDSKMILLYLTLESYN